MSTIGVVVIGRNEGMRLAGCLESVRRCGVAAVVYVDSQSSDGSAALAAERGAEVVELDGSAGLTAARARNAGAAALFARRHDLDYVQFLDGDTEVHPGWIAHAADYLDHHPAVAVVCGRRRERAPEASVYNLLADLEWDTPLGTAAEFGGDAMIRAAVFQRLEGYDARFIAGEEPEFAARIRLAGATGGGKIVRLNHEMTLHDLHMMHFYQWWKRCVRSGHAMAQLARAHGRVVLHGYVRRVRSVMFWTVAVPIAVVVLAALSTWWVLVLLPLAGVVLAGRIARHRVRRGDDLSAALTYGFFTALGKFPEAWGIWTFYRHRLQRRQPVLIEYKAAPPAVARSVGANGGGDKWRREGGPVNPESQPLSNTT